MGGDVVMRVEDFPELDAYRGHTLITTDGTTLLGADDKAGVAEILTAARYLLDHPEIPHGKLRIAFTPDEEIGRGVDRFDVAAFGADYAYTLDGGGAGELEYENFNAAAAEVRIRGRNVHPGYAKGKMINALAVAGAFDALLPQEERPERTEGREGFYHLNRLNGTVDEAEMHYILRDHDRKRFEDRKKNILRVAERINRLYGPGTVEVSLRDEYYNMREALEGRMQGVDIALAAMRRLGLTPVVRPVRGGTDGARLSYMGLPCPNLFAGGQNFHGRYEFVSVEVMEQAVRLVVEIARGWAEAFRPVSG